MLSKYGLPTYYEVCFSILLTDASLESASAPGAYNGQMLNKMFIDLKPTFIRGMNILSLGLFRGYFLKVFILFI